MVVSRPLASNRKRPTASCVTATIRSNAAENLLGGGASMAAATAQPVLQVQLPRRRTLVTGSSICCTVFLWLPCASPTSIESEWETSSGESLGSITRGTVLRGDSLCALLSSRPSQRIKCDGVWEGIVEEGVWREITMIKDLFKSRLGIYCCIQQIHKIYTHTCRKHLNGVTINWVDNTPSRNHMLTNEKSWCLALQKTFLELFLSWKEPYN